MKALAIPSCDLAQRVSDALKRSHMGDGSKYKRVARKVGVNERTARNLVDAANAPSASTLVALMAAYDEVYLEVLRMAGREPADEGARVRIEHAISILCGDQYANQDRSRHLSPPRAVQVSEK